MLSNLAIATHLLGGPIRIKTQMCVTSEPLLNDNLLVSKTSKFQFIHWLCVVQL